MGFFDFFRRNKKENVKQNNLSVKENDIELTYSSRN